LGVPCIRIFAGSTRPEADSDRSHDPSWGVFGSTLSADKTKEEVVDVCTDAVAKLIDYAKEKDVILAVENHGGIPETIAECERFREKIKSPYLQFTLDLGNLLKAGEDPIEASSILADSAAHVHLKDVKKTPEGSRYPYDDGGILGEVVVDFPGCIAKLKEAGYNGYYSVEIAEKTGDPWESVRKSVEYIRSLAL